MAPLLHHIARTAKTAIVASGPDIARLSAHHLQSRSLSVNSTQKVTLGIIVVYVVVIALLWNIPYVRWSLWPFKVHTIHHAISSRTFQLTNICLDACHCLPRIRTRHNSMLHRWPR